MRKILLATSALVLAAGAAQAGDLKLEMSGYADFRAGIMNQSDDVDYGANAVDTTNHDFETEVKLVVDAIGRGAGDFEYGARVSFWNGSNNNDGFNGGQDQIKTHDAYVYMGSNWGRVIAGDHTGASDMLVYAPFVGQGQIDGTFTDFTANNMLSPFFPAYIDNEEVSTKVTYYTPVVSGFQLGVSYIPQFYDYGQNVVKFNQNAFAISNNGAAHPYNHVVEAGAQWQGNFDKVNVTLSGLLTTGDAEAEFAAAGGVFQDFTAWALGGQLGYAGFTLGGSYYDPGDFLALVGQNNEQSSWSLGATYEFGQAAVGVSYIQAEGYVNNAVSATTGNIVPGFYVEDYTAVGVGGEYKWMPGLTTSVDAVFFDQDAAGVANDNDGNIFLLSQRVDF
ncbi:MAG: porin [Bdellovibrionales bacterium]